VISVKNLATRSCQKLHHEKQAAAHTELARCMNKSAPRRVGREFEWVELDRGAAPPRYCRVSQGGGRPHVSCADDHLACHKKLDELPAEEVPTEGNGSDLKALCSHLEKLVGAMTDPMRGAHLIPTAIPRKGQQSMPAGDPAQDPVLASVIGSTE